MPVNAELLCKKNDRKKGKSGTRKDETAELIKEPEEADIYIETEKK